MNRLIGTVIGSLLASGMDPRAFTVPGYSMPRTSVPGTYSGTVDQQQARIVAAEAKRARKCERRLREGRHINGSGVA